MVAVRHYFLSAIHQGLRIHLGVTAAQTKTEAMTEAKARFAFQFPGITAERFSAWTYKKVPGEHYKRKP